MRNVVIIGGGLAGLISSVQLIRAGIPCTVIEKKSYPFHRVCGEYVSNEAVPFLKASGLYPEEFKLPQVKFFEFSSRCGEATKLPLDLGGFGISRYTFDHSLYGVAQREGVTFLLNTEVAGVDFREADEQFGIATANGHLVADVVVGAFGKRSKIDVQQARTFVRKRSPWVGVKYHIRGNHPANVVALHSFPGGYCGACNVENGLTNLCYLTHRDNLKTFRDIPEMERMVLFQNPHLRRLFAEATFVSDKPEVINEISFETKAPVENHILMAGDAAGMITPVCGNGMAIAIRSGRLLAECVASFCFGRISRRAMEHQYRRRWNDEFRARLWFGRHVQRLFVDRDFSRLAVKLAEWTPATARYIVSKTHGQPF